jgi:transposase|tara:strand:+ start:181 stop:1167 length:987 start_codon:yes stop_codon:yes gene_type:complete
MKHLALDAHTRTSELSVRDARGRLIDCRQVPTEAHALIESIGHVAGRKTLVVEESNLAGWLKRTLEPHVTRFIVCNPKQNHWIAKDEEKDDPLDANKLSHLLYGGFLKEVHHPAEPQQRFKNLVLHHYRLSRSVVRYKNQINAKYREQGFVCRSYLKQGIPDELDEIRSAELEDLCDILEAAESIGKRAKTRLQREARKFPQIARFQEMPGIGLIRASTFFAIIDTPFRFPSRSKIWVYCGIGLKTRASAERVYRQGPNQEFNRYLKSAVKQAVGNAVRQKGRFQDQYDRLVKLGTDPRQARVTVSRSIVSTMWSIWKSGEQYNPEMS